MTDDDPALTAFFKPATMGSIDSSSVVDLPTQTAIGRVRSLLFDTLRLQGTGGSAWRTQVVSIPLANRSRRRLRVTVRGQLTVSCEGWARASLGCEHRLVSTELACLESLPTPSGELPVESRALHLGLVLPRVARPRCEIRIIVLLEVAAKHSQGLAETAVDSIDIEAL